MTEDLNQKNERLGETINQLVDSHPEFETTVRNIAARQPANATAE